MMLQYFTGISTLPSLCFHSPVWGKLSGWTTFPPAHCNFISWRFSTVHHGSSQLKCIKSFVSKWGVQSKEDTATWKVRTAMRWSRAEDQCVPTHEYKVCPFFLSAAPDWEVTFSSCTTSPSGKLQSGRRAFSSACVCWERTSFSSVFTLNGKIFF